MARVSFRNLRRRLFAMIAIISLVLCLATVGLWVRSYWRDDFVARTLYQAEEFPDGFLATEYLNGQFSEESILYLLNRSHFRSNYGMVSIARMRLNVPPKLGSKRGIWHRDAYNSDPAPGIRGLAHFRASRKVAGDAFANDVTSEIEFPHWSLALLLAILPTWWLTPIIRTRRRARRGCCLNCGYDLRESPGRCPECGAGVAAASETL